MDRGPQSVDGLDESVVLFVGYQPCCMPPCASVHHVEDHELVDEQKVTLHLLVELIGEINTAGIAGTRFGPLSTYLASADNLWDKA